MITDSSPPMLPIELQLVNRPFVRRLMVAFRSG